jgi:K+-transporting ATPase KdpF subunit
LTSSTASDFLAFYPYHYAMMLALLLLSLATFGYLCYVLLKPEEF